MTYKKPKFDTETMKLPLPRAIIGGLRNETQDIEKLLGDVNTKLNEISGPLKQNAEAALAEAKKAGEVSAELKAKLDKELSTFNDLSAAVKKLENALEENQTKLSDMSQNMVAGKSGAESHVMTLGEAIIANEADRIAKFVENGARGGLSLNVENAITTTSGAAGLIARDQITSGGSLPRPFVSLRALLSTAKTGSDLVIFPRQTLRDNKAAGTAEGTAAPESSYKWESFEAPVRKVTHVTHISEEALEDADQLQSEIDIEMRYGLDLEENKQLLMGDGAGANLAGIMLDASAFSAQAGMPNSNQIDRLRLAFAQIVLGGFAATGVVLNPLDFAGIELLKETGTGRYVVGNPSGSGITTLWRVPVSEQFSMPKNSFLAGDFKRAATIYDRREAEVLISSEHGDNFIEGMLTMKGTKRLALAKRFPTALVKGDFTIA